MVIRSIFARSMLTCGRTFKFTTEAQLIKCSCKGQHFLLQEGHFPAMPCHMVVVPSLCGHFNQCFLSLFLLFKPFYWKQYLLYTTNPTEHGQACSASIHRAMSAERSASIHRAIFSDTPYFTQWGIKHTNNWFADVDLPSARLALDRKYLVLITQEGVKHTKYGTLPKSARQMLAEHSVDIAR